MSCCSLRNTCLLTSICSARAHPLSPFSFNFFGLSFPELCLQCLSAPQSLLSSPAIPDPLSWSIDAPEIAHYEILRDWLGAKLQAWRRQRQPQYGPNHHHDQQTNGANGHSHEEPTSDSLADIEGKYKEHLSSAYDTWRVLSEKEKHHTWLLECAKAFTREQEAHRDTKRELDLAEQKLQLLRSQLGKTHKSPEPVLYPPAILPISRETATQLPNSGAWNHENLLRKWRSRIQSTRNMQLPLPPPSPWATATPPNLNSNHTNGGAYPHARSENRKSHLQDDADAPSDEDEDLVDAPGDEDDLGQHGGMSKGMLDPSLRDQDADGEGQAGGRMLMGLREYGREEGRMGIGRG